MPGDLRAEHQPSYTMCMHMCARTRASKSETYLVLERDNASTRLADSLNKIGLELKRGGVNKTSLIQRAEDETENGRVLSQVSLPV